MNDPTNNRDARHTIRLRGPCKLRWIRGGTQQAEVRVQIPCEIVHDLFKVTANSETDVFVLRRTFNKPTGLDTGQRVTLEFSNFAGAYRLLLNHESDQAIVAAIEGDAQTGDAQTVDVTESLLDANCLEVEFHSLPGFAGDIQLVIEG